jgi:hypothetical protein
MPKATVFLNYNSERMATCMLTKLLTRVNEHMIEFGIWWVPSRF